MRRRWQTIAVICLISAAARGGRFAPSPGDAGIKALVAVAEREIEEKNYEQAVKRLETLVRERREEMVAEGNVLAPVREKVRGILVARRDVLAAEYEKQLAAGAWQAVAGVKQNPEFRPEEMYGVARRFPLAPAARDAMAAAGERAVELGDVDAARVYFGLASASGWVPSGENEKTIAAVNAAAPRAGWSGAIPVSAAWMSTPEGMFLPKFLPAAGGGIFFVATPRAVLAFGADGKAKWNATMPKPWAETPRADRTNDVNRGTLNSPTVLCDRAGTPRVIVARQLQSAAREYAIKAFRASDGKVLWSTENEALLRELIFVGEPTVVGRYVYAAAIGDIASGSALYLVALDVTSGRVLWQTILGSRSEPSKVPLGQGPRVGDRDAEDFWQLSPPMIDGEQIVVTPNSGMVCAVGRFDGKVRWITTYEPIVIDRDKMKRYREERLKGRSPALPLSAVQMMRWSNTPVSVENVIVAAPQDMPGAMGLDRETGKLLWSQDAEAPTLIGAADEVAVFQGAFLVMGVDAKGQPRWRYEPAKGVGIAGPGVVREGIVYVPTSGGMVGMSARDGIEVKREVVPDFGKVLQSEAARKVLEELGAMRWMR